MIALDHDAPARYARRVSVKARVEAVWREQSARVIGHLVRLVRDVDLAEELAHDALVAALEAWPKTGVPDNPGAWLTTTAKNRALDRLRKDQLVERKHTEIGREVETVTDTDAIEAALDDDVGDDVLRLVFIACHPILSTEARVALSLRLLGGLTTEEIARAFLTPVSTVAQRITRAKRALSEANVPFEVPRGDALVERTESVLEVIYLVFNEGYAATAGDSWGRPELCAEALRLGHVLTRLLPDVSEVHGLVALMEIQASRLRARVTVDGEPIRLLDQDRSQWDAEAIERGLRSLERALGLKGRGSYVLQAEIAACHGRARAAEETDWVRIVDLYGELARATPSPVIDLNRAVAVSMAYGPAPALALVEALAEEPRLARYHLVFAVRGDLLEKLGRCEEAKAAFEAAAALTRNERERALLMERAMRAGE